MEKILEQLTILSDLSTRMDERLKAIKDNQKSMDDKIEGILENNNDLIERISKLEASDFKQDFNKLKEEVNIQVNSFEKRLTNLEKMASGFEGKWKVISGYLIHLIWIVLACWILMKLNLTTPPIP